MPINKENEFDIVIAGAGMVGASLACLLAKSSLRVALLDRQVLKNAAAMLERKSTARKFDARVSAISQASQILFTDLGIWQDIISSRVCSYKEMSVWDAEGTGSIHFSAAEVNQSHLGSIIENSIITTALHKRLQDEKNISLISPFSIETLKQVDLENERLLQLDSVEGHSIRAKLVVAADGANSKIRQLMDFKCREWDYEHHALVTTVRTELPHEDTALQRFLETGPLAFLPLRVAEDDDDQHYCSIVWSMLPEKAERMMTLSEEQFNAEIGLAIESKLGNIEWSDKRFTFPLRQRHAVDYAKDGVVLVGDAAHTIHPLAGQGVNLGLLDAKALAEEIMRGTAAGRSVSDPMIPLRYQRKRKGNNLSMMWLMEGFKRLFAEQNLTVRWLRNAGMNSVDKFTPLKNQIVRRAMGLDA